MKDGMITNYKRKELSKEELLKLIDKNFGGVGNIAVLVTVESEKQTMQTLSFGKLLDENVLYN